MSGFSIRPAARGGATSNASARGGLVPRRWRLLVASVAVLLILPHGTWGQNVTEPSLRAALVYNFARFTEWPSDALSPNAPFVACVLGSTAVGDALERVVKDRVLAGHKVSVARVTLDGPFRPCHLLYVSTVTNAQAMRLAAVLRGLPVLTIVDVEDVTVAGGMARVFVENGKLRFDLDRGLARQSRLELSSKLLSLAGKVIDEPSAVTR